MFCKLFAGSTGLNLRMCTGSVMVKSSTLLNFFMLVPCGRYLNMIKDFESLRNDLVSLHTCINISYNPNMIDRFSGRQLPRN